ncbi:AF4/FMR2 family member 1-like isoform X1 [Vidua macroura]|uniref:AF4/FMR2 family member 1-like isoform X1 n=1 Tax=Vidua macroura TaxID=187451 RepID=UPI0023A88891|nr:AF4/FMR2 family member 1-like isoform X1 [Vidua macroura]
MEPTDNQNSDNSWSYNRDLLRILEQDRRRRQVAPEKDPFLENTPIFPKPYKTNKEDELSRRIKKVLRNVDPKFLFLVHDSPLIPLWIPKKPKIKSQTQSHRPASSKTNPYEDIWRESSPESLDLTPEQSYDACDTDLSKQRSEAKAPQSEILPEPVKKKKLIDVPSTGKTLKVVEKPSSSLASPRALQSQHKRMTPAQPSISESKSTRDCHSSSVSALPRAPASEPIVHIHAQSVEEIMKEMSSPLSPLLPPLQSPARTDTSKFPLQAKAKKPSDVPLIEEIFKEMNSSPPSLLSHLQMPTRAETSKLPLATKEFQPDGSAAQKQKQAGTASETLLSSQPRTSALQSQHKRMAPAQPSISESKSTRECHSSSVCDREISSSDSEDSLPRVLDLPASKPEPPAFNKWYLHNIVTQIKRGAVQREGLREITHGNGHEEGVKQEQGISSNSCQQHSKAREPSYKSCGQVAKDFHKTFAQVAEDTHKTSGQVTKALQESHVTSTHSSLKPLVHTKEALPRKIVGIKRPSEPLEHDKSKKVLKLESEPGHSQRSELEVRDQSFKDKLKVQEAEKPNPAFRKGVKLGVQKPSKNREDKDPDKSFVHMPKVPDQSCGQVAKPTHESDITSKPSFLKPPVNTKEALPKDTLGIKRPSMSQVHDESKRVWKIKNETGLLQVIDQSCKDQPKVTVKPKAIDKKDLKPALHKPSEKRKGSHQVNTTGFLEPRLLRHAQEYDALMPSGHRPGDLHKGKVPLPPGEKKLFPPAREVDMKRKAMRSPEESPRKKREDKGDTPRKKKE